LLLLFQLAFQAVLRGLELIDYHQQLSNLFAFNLQFGFDVLIRGEYYFLRLGCGLRTRCCEFMFVVGQCDDLFVQSPYFLFELFRFVFSVGLFLDSFERQFPVLVFEFGHFDFQVVVAAVYLLIGFDLFVEFDLEAEVVVEELVEDQAFFVVRKFAEGIRLEDVPFCDCLVFALFALVLFWGFEEVVLLGDDLFDFLGEFGGGEEFEVGGVLGRFYVLLGVFEEVVVHFVQHVFPSSFVVHHF
jgi:hypothetical protein